MRDVLEAIGDDLSAAAAQKRRHFVPAALGAAALCLALLAMAGTRDDFAALPPWRQLAFAASWIVGGLLFPAVGVGLWFPGRAGRIALAAAGIALPVCAVLGGPAAHEGDHPAGPCGLALACLGLALVGLGALSGAFAQRRAARSTGWVAAGLTLSAATTSGWICPYDAPTHLLWGHVAPALALVVVAAALGRWMHARQRR
ncbi:MAG: hypothetical protein ACE37F_15265 [Nannocystaceae bacterium]|nr:hypothetical protein [bacterium]